MLTFKQCNYLMSIVEEGSFIAASEKLFIAQSALSRQIKNLEDSLGFIVFDRSEKRIKLTPAGLALYKSLKIHLENLDNSIELAQKISRGEDRTIRIGHSSSIILDNKKLKKLDDICEKYNINIEINTISSEAQIEAILSGDIDIGFIRPPIYHSLDDLGSKSLYKSILYVAVSASDQHFNNKNIVDISDLKDFRFVSTPHAERGGLSYLVSNLCLSNGFLQKRARISSRKLSQLNLVANGFGICIVPEEFSTVLPRDVKLIAINDQNNQSEVKLIWKKNNDQITEDCAKAICELYKLDC
jgi:DNA-binding transcriptional LysR family regulator